MVLSRGLYGIRGVTALIACARVIGNPELGELKLSCGGREKYLDRHALLIRHPRFPPNTPMAER